MTEPIIYLATDPNAARGERLSASGIRISDPTVYLAHASNVSSRDYGVQGDHALLQPREDEPERATKLNGNLIDDELKPPLLISFVYVRKFLQEQHRYRYRHWVMDSGAYSAWKSGTSIDLADYTALCRERLTEDQTLREVFALDVVGDWRASVRNAEQMWAAGVPAIPTFHHGEPEDVLLGLARDYPKVAIGGIVGLNPKAKQRFIEQCFARVWPKPLHGFGVGTKAHVMAVPWHSVDATNWEIGPCKFGSWKSFGGAQLSVRGSTHDLRNEIKWYADLERLARHRWAREMEELRGQLTAAGWRGYEAPAVHLAVQGQNGQRGGLTHD
jgi:hypothetical protein